MDKQNKYKPVKHTKATTVWLLAADPELKKAYDARCSFICTPQGGVKPGRSSPTHENQGIVARTYRGFSGKPRAFAFVCDAAKIRCRLRQKACY